jgi:hypothetical protein
MAAALGALLYRGLAHLLPLFKVAGALFAKIFVRRQDISPHFILAALFLRKKLQPFLLVRNSEQMQSQGNSQDTKSALAS